MADTLKLTSRELQALTTRAVIVDAAEELFLRDGFAGTSLGAIAAAARVSKALIVHHFKSKEALLVAVAARQQEEQAQILAAIAPPEPWDASGLCHALVAYRRHLLRREQHRRFLQLCQMSDLPEEMDRSDPFRPAVRAWVAAVQADGGLRSDLPAAILAESWLALARSPQDPDADPDATARHLADHFLNGAIARA